jgi:hypothetical protein
MKNTKSIEQMNTEIDHLILLLEPLGIECSSNYKFYWPRCHSMERVYIDLSDINPEYACEHCIKAIAEASVKHGRDEMRLKIKDLLTLEVPRDEDDD